MQAQNSALLWLRPSGSIALRRRVPYRKAPGRAHPPALDLLDALAQRGAFGQPAVDERPGPELRARELNQSAWQIVRTPYKPEANIARSDSPRRP